MPRQKTKIDIETVEKLCRMQCTAREIAAFFDLDEKTIDRRKASDPGLAAAMEKGYQSGLISLRRKMYEMAMTGDRTMCIWLSKNHLNMRDRQEHTGKDGGPLQIVITPEEAEL